MLTPMQRDRLRRFVKRWVTLGNIGLVFCVVLQILWVWVLYKILSYIVEVIAWKGF